MRRYLVPCLGAIPLTDLTAGEQLGGRLVEGPPKNDAGRRAIALDKTTITALCEQQARQQAEQTAAGTRWTQTGHVFTTRTGKPVGPDRLTRIFGP